MCLYVCVCVHAHDRKEESCHVTMGERGEGHTQGGLDKRHVRRLLLSQLREVNTFFPSHVSVASTVPR